MRTSQKNQLMLHYASTQSDRLLRQELIRNLATVKLASATHSLRQLLITGSLYLLLLTAMYLTLHVSIWMTLVLALPTAGLVVRLFIIQHDCGHGAYFRSKGANNLVGRLCSIATLTPFANWRRQHAGHHVVWNNLDRRNSGADIYSSCLTLAEYRSLTRRKRFLYRLMKHPLVLQLIVPPLVFLLLYRLPFDTPRHWRRERRSVLLTNLSLAAIFILAALALGWRSVLLVQLLVTVPASIVGVWLFAVQHRFEATEWMRQSDWTVLRASLEGSSYLKLPRILQWFTGNIGFHHVHHLLPRAPNYRLQDCHEILRKRDDRIRILTLAEALRAPSFALWDEAEHRMIPFPRRG